MDASGGQVLWESSVETAQIGLPRSWLDANSPLLAGKVVTYAAEKTDGDRAVSSLISLDLSGGALRQIVQSEDCTLTPLAVQDAILIAHAACTRGAAGDELWGIDPASGEIGWRYLLHDANESWAAHPATGGFMVIQIFAAPDRIVVELLDPATGNRLVETAQTVPSGVWSGTAWTAGTVWLAIHDLVEIDLTTGEARIVWP
jgi:hypothetical protein